TSENAATQAPRASASDSTAAPVTTAFLRSIRAPRRMSRTIESSQGSNLMSRLRSRSRSGLPNRRATSAAAASRVHPESVSSRTRSSMWNWSSSSSSDWTLPERNTFARRDSNDIALTSRVLQDLADRRRDRLPARLFRLELLSSAGGDLVDAGPAPRRARRPARLDPARLFEAMERRIERPFLDSER